MTFAYFYHLINIPLVACFLYVWRPRARFREMMSGIMVVSFLGMMGTNSGDAPRRSEYAIWPASR